MRFVLTYVVVVSVDPSLFNCTPAWVKYQDSIKKKKKKKKERKKEKRDMEGERQTERETDRKRERRRESE